MRSILPEPASLPPMFIHLLVREPGEVSPQPQTRIDQMAKGFHWAQPQKFMRLTKGFPFQYISIGSFRLPELGRCHIFQEFHFFQPKEFQQNSSPAASEHNNHNPYGLPNNSRAASCGAKLRSLAPKVRCMSRRQTFISGMLPRKVGRWLSQLGLAKT